MTSIWASPNFVLFAARSFLSCSFTFPSIISLILFTPLRFEQQLWVGPVRHPLL